MDIYSVDKEICGEVWTSKQIKELLTFITQLGNRFAGSEKERESQQYIIDKFRSWGLETDFHRFQIDSWKRGESKLNFISNSTSTSFLSRALNFSGSTHGKFQSYEIIDVGSGTPSDYERLADRIKGNAVLVACNCYQGSAKTHKNSKYSEAIKIGAKAYISGRSDGPIAVPAGSVSYDELKPIPAVSISQQTVEFIRTNLQQQKAMIEISVDGERTKPFSGNIIGFIPGQNIESEIVIGAHLDSHDICQGAIDNGSGVAVVCELARLFAKYSGKLHRSIRFVLFTGEELGLQGSKQYCLDRIPDPSKIFLYYNFDITVCGGFPTLYTMTGHEYPDYWLRLSADLGYRFPIKNVLSRSSDQFSFYRLGIPCIWQTTHKKGSRGPYGFSHTIFDTLDKVNMTELREAAMMAARVLLRLASEKEDFMRAFIPEDEKSGLYDDT